MEPDIKETEKIIDAERIKRYPTSNNAETAVDIAKKKIQKKKKFSGKSISNSIVENAEKQKSKRERETCAKENIAKAIVNIGEALNKMVQKEHSGNMSEKKLLLRELKTLIRTINMPDRKTLQTALLLNTDEMLDEFDFLKQSNKSKQQQINDLVDFSQSVIDAEKLKRG